MAFRTLLAAVVALALAAGASAGTIVKVGAAANGKSVTLQRGDTLVVSLAGNASTGYAWRVASCCKRVLKPLGTAYAQPPTTQPKVGAPGTYTLRFRAVGKGATTLRLAYARSWEPAKPPARTFAVTVTVR